MGRTMATVDADGKAPPLMTGGTQPHLRGFHGARRLPSGSDVQPRSRCLPAAGPVQTPPAGLVQRGYGEGPRRAADAYRLARRRCGISARAHRCAHDEGVGERRSVLFQVSSMASHTARYPSQQQHACNEYHSERDIEYPRVHQVPLLARTRSMRFMAFCTSHNGTWTTLPAKFRCGTSQIWPRCCPPG
jgi:hypothetical protein